MVLLWKAIFDVKEEHRWRRDIDALRSCVIVEEKEEEEEEDDDNEDDEVDDEEVVGRLKSAYYDDVNDYDNDDMDSNRAASFWIFTKLVCFGVLICIALFRLLYIPPQGHLCLVVWCFV